MKYEIRQEFAFDADTVTRAMLSPDIASYLEKEMKSLIAMELLERQENGDVISRRVRYRLHPVIESIGPRKVPPEVFEWVEHSSFDRRTLVMKYENVPTKEKVRKLFENHGEIRFMNGPGGCARIMTGELKVHIPLLGGMAEKIIYRKASELLDEEAAALRRFLSR